MPDWVIWLIVAIVVIALIAALLVVASRKKKERDRVQAGELREQAAAQATGVQKRQAHAKETEAEAAAARAEADRKQAEAERLGAEAEERRRVANSESKQHEEHLRRADELDPDVNTRSNDYDGPDTRTTGTGVGGAQRDGASSDGTRTFTEPDGTEHRGVDGETAGTTYDGTGDSTGDSRGETGGTRGDVPGRGTTGGSHSV